MLTVSVLRKGARLQTAGGRARGKSPEMVAAGPKHQNGRSAIRAC